MGVQGQDSKKVSAFSQHLERSESSVLPHRADCLGINCSLLTAPSSKCTRLILCSLDLHNEHMQSWSESRMRCRVARSVQVACQVTQSKDCHTCVSGSVEGD